MNQRRKSPALLLLLSGLLLCALSACSGFFVPRSVKDALSRDFPAARQVEWDEERDLGLYEAEFFNGGTKTKVTYAEDGTRELTEEYLRFSQLPVPVQASVRSLFPGQEVEDVLRRTDAMGLVFYSLEVGDVERIFDATGSYLGMDVVPPMPLYPGDDAHPLPTDSI